MENINEGLKIYSEEVQDVLSDPPKAIYRWGNTILLGFIIVIIVMSWFIKYPDVIVSQVAITTNNPPEKLIAKTSGKIEIILIKDRTNVLKKTPLAVIENAANYKDIFLLKNIVDTINIYKNNFPFEKFNVAQLGEIEGAFALFQKEYVTEKLNSKLQPYKVEGALQSSEIIQLKERLNLLLSQQDINLGELDLAKTDVNRYQSLFNKGIISEQELGQHKLSYLQSQRNYKTILSSISQIKSSLNELNKNSKTTQINAIKENVSLERNEIQSFFQLKKAIKDWELNFVLRSSIEGKVTFLQIWKENQRVTAGDNVFSIIPKNASGYIGKLKAPALNSGKIKINQTVNIKLANYPDREFGMIKGVIKNISLTPDKDGNLLIDVSLPDGLKTSYKKEIVFQQEMTGNADIITEDLRLIERLLYQFRDIFKQH